jgi:hypothetical protein
MITNLHFPAKNLQPAATETMVPPPPFRDIQQLFISSKPCEPRKNDGPLIEVDEMVISPPTIC